MNNGEQLRSARCVSYLRDFRARLAPLSSASSVRELTEAAAGLPIWQMTAEDSYR
jgi:hypothetical protein